MRGVGPRLSAVACGTPAAVGTTGSTQGATGRGAPSPRQDGHRVCRTLDRNAGGGMAVLVRPALTAAATTTPVERTCLARRERLDATRKEALDHRRGLVVGQPGLLRHRRDERGCGQRFPSPISLPPIALSTWLSSRFPLPAQGENPLAPPRALWRLGLDDASDASSSRSRCSLRPRALIPYIMEFIPIKPLVARGGRRTRKVCRAQQIAITRARTPSYHRATRVHRAARSLSCTVRIMARDRPELLRPPYQVYWGTLYC